MLSEIKVTKTNILGLHRFKVFARQVHEDGGKQREEVSRKRACSWEAGFVSHM